MEKIPRSFGARPMAMALFVSILLFSGTALACRKRHQSPFELFDLSRTVAVVKVLEVPPPGPGGRPGAGDVALHVERQLKGKPRAALGLIARENNTSC